MKEIDFDRALTLMQVIANVVNISPQDQNLLGEAQAELREINSAAAENANERAAKRAAEEAKAHAAEQAQLRKDNPLPSGEPIDPNDDLAKPYKPSNGPRKI